MVFLGSILPESSVLKEPLQLLTAFLIKKSPFQLKSVWSMNSINIIFLVKIMVLKDK